MINLWTRQELYDEVNDVALDWVELANEIYHVRDMVVDSTTSAEDMYDAFCELSNNLDNGYNEIRNKLGKVYEDFGKEYNG